MDPMDNEREIERWMDGALGQYGKVEPRAGLENRLLTSLQSERNRMAWQRRWWWAAATLAVAAMVIAGWFGKSHAGRSPAKVVETATMQSREKAGVSKPPKHPRHGDDRAHAGRHNRLEQSSKLHSPRDQPTKLDQFPSPAPLNEQEQMLARYVGDFPQQAALVARSQTDLQKQHEREMAAPWPNKNSDQPE